MAALNGSPVVDLGTAEEAWEQSEFLSGIPYLSLDRLLGSSRRVVVVSPHPDDEVLGCGGLLSLCAQRHIPVLVVSVSDGENCYPGNTDWPPARLRVARKFELTQALLALGLTNPHILSLEIPDGQIAAHEQQLVNALLGYLRDTDVVFAPWSFDGHPDHEATSRAAARASEISGSRLIEFPIWAWHWVAADGEPFADLTLGRLELGVDAHRAKLAALACFHSQVVTEDPAIPMPILPPHVLNRFARTYEVFIHE